MLDDGGSRVYAACYHIYRAPDGGFTKGDFMGSPELLAPCGLYCGLCAILIADRDNNDKFKEKLTGVYGVPAGDLHCKGCMSEDVFGYCRVCPIRDCTQQKGLQGCHQCDEFPCSTIENFPLPVGKKVILRAIPEWRDLGTEAWVKSELARYHCPACGEATFRGARRCRGCGEAVSLD